MKILWRVLGALLLLVLLLFGGLKLYFTDARLKALVLPPLREATQSEVQIDYLTVTWLRTFPHFGVRMENVMLPDPAGDTVMAARNMTASIGLWPLLQDQIYLHSLSLDGLRTTYRIMEDGATNFDFLMSETETDATSDQSTYAVAIPKFQLSDATLRYWDEATDQKMELSALNGEIALSLNRKISTDVNIGVGSVWIAQGEQVLVNKLPVSIKQNMVLDPEREQLELSDGEFKIKGLRLSLSGIIQKYTSDSPLLDLTMSSASDDFGELLSLVPAPYDEQIKGWTTKGSIAIDGSMSGTYSETVLPRFDVRVNVADGYLKNPQYSEAIENVTLKIDVTNDLVRIANVEATAGSSRVAGKGEISDWLGKDPRFVSDLDAELDLSLIPQFYDLASYDIDQLSGQLRAFAKVQGRMEELDQTKIEGSFILREGALKYTGVAQPIDKIEANVRTSADQILVDRIEMKAGENHLQVSGTVMEPLVENRRRLALQTDFNFDLASLKQFYPIADDTLQVAGALIGKLNFDGAINMDHPEQMISGGTITLQDGRLFWYDLPRELELIQARVELQRGVLSIKESAIKTGGTSVSYTGEVADYMGENPILDGKLNGKVQLDEWQNYPAVRAYADQLRGQTEWDIAIAGPLYQPEQLQLSGSGRLTDVAISSASLPLPISGLMGRMKMTPRQISLDTLQMLLGRSDYAVRGSMTDYMNLLATESDQQSRSEPRVTGQYHSQLVDVDELIDWDAESSDEPIAVTLPALEADVSANIDTLRIMGSQISKIGGQIAMNPDSIAVQNATGQWMEGTMAGNFSWVVPQPDRTEIRFKGNLKEVSASAFLQETRFLGKAGNLHQYVSGKFSTDVDYWTVLDPTLMPAIGTTRAKGSFGMTKTRLKDHPIQLRLAEFLKVDELKNMALDQWEASYTIADTVLTLKDMQLSSGQLGLRLDGTQHLVSNRIDYYATVLLPPQFKASIARVLTEQAANALQRDDGIIEVAVRIRGTMEDPKVSPDEAIIKKAVDAYLKRVGRKLLDKLGIQGR